VGVPGDSGHTSTWRGRTAHEAIFIATTGNFRWPIDDASYSPFRHRGQRGLALAMLGYAEELNYTRDHRRRQVRKSAGLGKAAVLATYEAAVSRHVRSLLSYCSTTDGIPIIALNNNNGRVLPSLAPSYLPSFVEQSSILMSHVARAASSYLARTAALCRGPTDFSNFGGVDRRESPVPPRSRVIAHARPRVHVRNG